VSEYPPARYGRLAYEAYCVAVGGHSAVTGARLPSWAELTERRPAIVAAWVHVAATVRAVTLMEFADQVDRGPTLPLKPSIISQMARECAEDAEDTSPSAAQQPHSDRGESK
jgi:hypothetical protein